MLNKNAVRKMEALEKEVQLLKAQLNTPSNVVPSPSSWSVMPLGTITVPIPESTRVARAAPLLAAATESTGSLKRRRAHFEAGTPPTVPDLDPISAGLITVEAAASYFQTFFSGCDRYVPVFDPLYDTLESVRHRSTLLFSAICSVGCRVLTGSESHDSRLLGVHTQRMLNVAIAAAPSRGGAQASMETVQALLVRACYAPERSLLVAVATRMALEIGLPEAYGVLSARCVAVPKVKMGDTPSSLAGSTASEDGDEDGATLIRKTRAWLHLLMMAQILHIDAGGPPGFRFRGSAQRCRILLESPSSTNIDLYLFSQVELNTLRARVHSTLSDYVRNHPPGERDDEEIMDMVGDARIDINLWFDDWTRIYDRHQSQMPWLTPNLAVQRCWAETMAMCCALKAAGIENVSAMSPTQRAILAMAKRSLWQHLDIILQEPRLYLQSIRYAMDFVWAKNAFCYLLLLKLSLLLPDDEGGGGTGGGGPSTNEDLVEKGQVLVEELSKAGGGLRDGARNNTSSLYLHLVRVSVDKFSHAIRSRNLGSRSLESRAESARDSGGSSSRAARAERRSGGQHEGGWSQDENQTELQSFVPEQFVFEWDFPGLTFFSSSPTDETGWMDDLLAGTFDGADGFYGSGWPAMDFNF